MFLINMNSLTRAWVSPDPRITFFHREGAKAAQLDAAPFGHSRRYLIKYGVYDPLDIPLVQMWIVVCDLLDQF
jgi:hypothetical protein